MTGGNDSHAGLHVSGRFPELEDALAERVLELRRSDPLAPLTVVVGSAAVRTHVGDLLVRRLHALANVTVVTLTRLAGELVTQAAGAPPAVLAGVARERFLRRLIREHVDRLEHFGAIHERPHFAQALAATFADLREAGIEPDAPWADAVAPAGVPDDDRNCARASDLDRLYRAYCTDLDARGLLDGAAVFAAAARAVPDRRSLGKVILYGIYDVSQVQEALIVALIAGGADVLEPLPRGAARLNEATLGAARSAGLSEQRRTGADKRTDLDRLAAVWRDSAAAVDEPLLFTGDQTLTVACVSDERAEAREAVRAVVAAA